MSAPETGAEVGPEMDSDIVGLDARAVRASVQIVSQASVADLARPTPCPDWTLAELLAHMTAQHNGFAAAGVLAGEFVLPEISPKLRFPAAEAIGFHFVDYVVHGWDVARALGRAYDLEPDVLVAALPIAQAVPDGERRRRPGAAFAPRVAASSGGPLGQIVALLGRRPDWCP